METPVHRYPLLILEHHLDSFGHVNHAEYFTLFEEARWDWVTQNGYGLRKIQETGLGPVILEAQIHYQRELKVRDQIIIESQVTEHNKMTSWIHQQMRGSDGMIHAQVRLKFGFFDLKQRKLIPPSDDWKRALGIQPK